MGLGTGTGTTVFTGKLNVACCQSLVPAAHSASGWKPWFNRLWWKNKNILIPVGVAPEEDRRCVFLTLGRKIVVVVLVHLGFILLYQEVS